jgi:predicted nucleic acid-binding protein
MNAMVLDASVVAAALFPEQHSKAARALLLSDAVLHAPDLIYPEVASVIWKRHGRREISGDEAADLLGDLMALPLEISPSEPLVRPALELALGTGQTVYDCLYVALGVMLKVTMISADKRLVNAVARGPLGDCVTWLGDAH